MYSAGARNECSHANPTNRMTPVTNCRNPGIQMPQMPVIRSTARSRPGNLNSSCGP
jgi:hypothetical protein